MNWKLILALSGFGLVMALATVFVIPSQAEPLFWLPILLFCAVTIARRQRSKPFLHGVCVGLANCVWITSIHVLFFNQYLAHHPQEAEMMADAPMAPRAMMLVTGPIIGLASGLLLGLFAWGATKLIKPAEARRVQ